MSCHVIYSRLSYLSPNAFAGELKLFVVARGTTAVETYSLKAVHSTTYLHKYCSIQLGLNSTRMTGINCDTTKPLTLCSICAGTLNQVRHCHLGNSHINILSFVGHL